MFFVTKVKRQLQKSPTSIGDGKNADLSYFSVGLQTPVPPAATLSVQKIIADRKLKSPADVTELERIS
ncbi:hypothetical protein [Lysinibacillus xylanilyticus]|uniref:hypothetical protein n=1 Tax=Lysinibacillus xylanilyticus TaxID=582475 RepID=UPI00382534F4